MITTPRHAGPAPIDGATSSMASLLEVGSSLRRSPPHGDAQVHPTIAMKGECVTVVTYRRALIRNEPSRETTQATQRRSA